MSSEVTTSGEPRGIIVLRLGEAGVLDRDMELELEAMLKGDATPLGLMEEVAYWRPRLQGRGW